MTDDLKAKVEKKAREMALDAYRTFAAAEDGDVRDFVAAEIVDVLLPLVEALEAARDEIHEEGLAARVKGGVHRNPEMIAAAERKIDAALALFNEDGSGK